jgi:hypothetical protein
MKHSHPDGATPQEIYAFADAMVNEGVPFARIISVSDTALKYQSKRMIARAELNFTKDDGRWQDRQWETVAAQLDSKARIVNLQIPPGARAWYVNLFDEKDLAVSSEHR